MRTHTPPAWEQPAPRGDLAQGKWEIIRAGGVLPWEVQGPQAAPGSKLTRGRGGAGREVESSGDQPGEPVVE